MSKYQLWSRDEYGQGSIIFTSDDIDEVVKKGKEEVTDLNVNNALTADDRERNWEAYMVMVVSATKKKTSLNYVYAGGDPRRKKDVYAVTSSGASRTVSIDDIPKAEIKIYLGNISTSRKEEIDWFAKDVKRNLIETMDHQDLQAKTQFFIKKV